MGWAAALCFAEGLPYGVFTEALPVFLRAHGASLVAIGTLGSLQLAWSLKVLWSPWVERLGDWRRWMGASLVVMAAALWVLAAEVAPAGEPAAAAVAVGVAALALFALASATQDLAIDGAFVRLVQPGEEGAANGWRMGAYRAAMLVGGGGAVAASAHVSWATIVRLLAAATLAMLVLPWRAPAQAAAPKQPPGDWLRALSAAARAPGALGAAMFVFLYKFGDMAMASMVKPFWLAHGRSAAEIGLVSISLGLGASLLGGLAGAAYLSRRPLPRGLWVLGAWQAVSNLGYAAVALAGLGRAALFAASILESLTQGMGTAAQLALVTRLCDRDHPTTQFALWTAIYGLSRALSGLVGGLGAAHLGFGPFFLVSFFLCLPAAACLPAVGRRLTAPSG